MPRTADRRATSRRLAHITIECVTPEIDCGRYPAKRVAGDVVTVEADIFRDGHDLISARVCFRGPGDRDWQYAPMTFDYNTDRWTGAFPVDRIGLWQYTVEAWTDVFRTWRSGLRKKVEAGQEVHLELSEGALLAKAASRSVKGAAKASLIHTAKVLEDRRETAVELRIARALDDELATLMEQLKPADLTRYWHELPLRVDRERARFASWYEFFPRSAGGVDADGMPRHGTFADAEGELPRIAELGFDVVYLPPIHPIGHQFRKGKNNSLVAGEDDVGSPWAIGNEHGGHDAVEPALGTLDDFDRFVDRARELGLEVALDYALQCAPDHPWVKSHPDWFHIRPDGTIAYAENPPKKYQDIYPINFWCEDREGLWNACRDVLLHWVRHGVTIFRVDNPHTKAFSFWEWVIAEVQRDHPEVIFFAEAFTRPKRMRSLAKLGFTMSYTYFTWKNTAAELRAYVEELTQTEMAEYYRGNFFANTPDILNEYLVHGGRPAFRIRALLAGTLLPLYGIYSGFELIEHTPVRPGSEEYLDSEKYQLRPRDWDQPGNISAELKRLNEIRRAERALQLYDNIAFHPSENPTVLFYRKSAPAGDLLIAVTTDYATPQETMVHVPIDEMGIAPDESYVVHDLLDGSRYTWRGSRNYVRLDPQARVGHVLRGERT
jgi:starch synthase (maltosyl-transferring)